MGFTVGQAPACYNGIPKASTVPLNKRGKGPKYKYPRTLPQSTYDVLIGFAKMMRPVGYFVMVCSVAFTIFYAFYAFNVHQLKLQK